LAKRTARKATGRESRGSPRRLASGRSLASRRSSGRSSRRGGGTLGGLSPERKRDLIGLILVAVSLFTVVSMLSATRGLVSSAWLEMLQAGFGWGTLVIPLAMLAGGLWLLLRRFEDRLPHVDPEQIVGAILLYLALLTLFHVVLRPADWPEALALARAGRGGGVVGAAVLEFLLSALGAGGAVVALLALGLAGVAFVAGLSVPELVAIAVEAGGWVRSRLRRRTTAAAPATSSQGSAATRPAYVPPALSESETPLPSPVAEPAAEPVTAAGPPAPPITPVWTLPELAAVLEPGAAGKADDEFDRERARMIEETLVAFGAPAKVVEVNRGPTITQFGVEPDFVEGRAGRRIKVKVSKISALADDLALALAAPSIRIEAPVPGKGYVGIEVPNTVISLVALRDVMESETFGKIRTPLRIGLGQDVSGHAVAADLTNMPHLLIAGTTGSGKSVCVNAILACLLLQNTPDDLKIVMVDPKRVELTYYNGIPHLLAPVVVELERVVPALQWVSREMDERYRRFAKDGARNIGDYNVRLQAMGQKKMPYLLVVIDELADLMMLAPDETERVITRLAQLARATGIHLVIATQRPSVDVVTGLIKANFPARIAFAVASSVDSRVILDQPGAERLLGRGDMLFQSPDAPAPVRMQGAYVSEAELSRLIRHWKQFGETLPALAALEARSIEAIPAGAPLRQAPLWDDVEEEASEDGDELFDEAVRIVREMRRASISLLQRRMRIGYTRAARLMDELEEKGIVGPAQQGSQAREVLSYGDLGGGAED
jgi:S-DNA-T family DNA segregation ATPase FtsK/SpoIIIE